MSMKKLLPWAQKIEVDNQILPFTEAKLTVDINDEGVFISIRGNAFHRHTCKEMFDPNVLHTVTLTCGALFKGYEVVITITISNAADSPIKRPFRNEDTIDEITKVCMVEAEVFEISNSDSDDNLITFEYRSTAIVAAE